MELTLRRKWKKSEYTVGKLYVGEQEFADTLEDTDRGLSDSMDTSTVKNRKVYGKTAIPAGTYTVEMTWSSKFHARAWCRKYGGMCPQIMGVKGFEGIRIHPFNRAEESLGCIAVGKNTKKGTVTQSTKYFQMLVDDVILPTTRRGEKVTITIK